MKKLCMYLFAGFFVFCSSQTLIYGVDLAVSPAAAPPGATQPATVPGPEAPEVKPKLVDLNSASVTELKTLPWIGEIYSKGIIKGRPYASKEDFASRHVIPSVTYEKLKNLITVE